MLARIRFSKRFGALLCQIFISPPSYRSRETTPLSVPYSRCFDVSSIDLRPRRRFVTVGAEATARVLGTSYDRTSLESWGRRSDSIDSGFSGGETRTLHRD